MSENTKIFLVLKLDPVFVDCPVWVPIRTFKTMEAASDYVGKTPHSDEWDIQEIDAEGF